VCSCDSGTPCQAHEGTRHDPSYFDPQNDVLGFDEYDRLPDPPAEYEVRDA